MSCQPDVLAALASPEPRSSDAAFLGNDKASAAHGDGAADEPRPELRKGLSHASVTSRGTLLSRTALNAMLAKRCGHGFSLTRNTTKSVAALVDLACGDSCETISLVTVRKEESIESEVLMELPPGTALQIKALGEGRRALVTTSGTNTIEGWISTKTRQNEPLVRKLAADEITGVKQDDAPDCGSKPSGPTFGASSSKIRQLLEAARSGDMALLKQVVEIGASTGRMSIRPSLNASDIRGKTALMYACAFGNKDVVEYLMSRAREVDVNAVDDTQKSALHHASKRSRSRREEIFDEIYAGIANLLLQNGAYIEARDHNGCTALTLAVANGDMIVTRQLLNAQANVNVKDFEGHKPLDYAKNFHHDAMATLLINAGARSNESDTSEDDSEPAAPTKAALRVPGRLCIADRTPSPRNNASQRHSVPVIEPPASPAQSTRERKEKKGDSGKKLTKRKTEKSLKVEGDQEDSEKTTKDSKKREKKPKKGKGKKPISAMMEAVHDENQEAVGQVAVQVATEEEDDRARALGKLAMVMDSVTAYKVLEAAVKEAEAAGATEADLATAQEKVKDLKMKAKARETLFEACEERHVKKLKAAIDYAHEAGLLETDTELTRANQMLAVEEPKQNARDGLQAAAKSGSIQEMKQAISEGERFNLTEEELREFQELLEGAESREKAEGLLKEAVEAKNVSKLRIAIQQARTCMVGQAEIDEAEEVLRTEEPKEEAREVLKSALDANTPEALRSAIQRAKDVGLQACDFDSAQQALEKIEEQERLLAAVAHSMEASQSADMTDVDSVRAAKEHLANAIESALACGVSETELHDAEVRRKKLHNTVEDLKGSIRVFCRIRPLSKTEAAKGNVEVTKQVNPMTLQVGLDSKNDHFQFDSVWTPGTQDEIFEDCKDLVQSAVDGYNVTIFAYGQTGAGKTYTMTGTEGDPGVAPRTITEIFRVIEQNKARSEFTVMASMLELHKLDLVDLLAKGNPAWTKQKLNIRTEKSGRVTVEHLIEEECRNAAELSALLQRGDQGRTVSSTSMNKTSSRSHSVLMINIVSVNRETGEQQRGKILIVDLAGSERLDKSEVEGDVKKESIEINKSLTALGDVIEALTKNAKVVPYRNHKLTMLMQDALGGSSKTLMFVNCSPAASNQAETLMSLKYAARAKKITNQQQTRGSIAAAGQEGSPR